jgi:hypothetical protein
VRLARRRKVFGFDGDGLVSYHPVSALVSASEIVVDEIVDGFTSAK